MKRIFKSAAGMAASAMILGALFVGSASAATTLGSTCTATDDASGAFFNPTLSTATSSGVITSWGATFATFPGPSPISIGVVEPTGNPNEWRFVNVGAYASVGSANFQTTDRVSISAGQTIAFIGDLPTCDTAGVALISGDLMDPPAAGTTFSTTAVPDLTLSAWAKIEADADGDGYGDETQDQCTVSKLASGPCVTVKPTATQIPAKNAFKLLLAANLSSTATATGTVKLPKTKTSKAKTLTFTSKPQAIVPGSLGLVSLNYPAKLKTALSKLSKKKSLKLAIAVSVDGPLEGTFDAATLNYSQKLKGTAK